MAKTETSKDVTETRFTKENIVLSATYAKRRDLVNALLEDGKEYTLKEVDTMIDNYLKGKVK